MKLAMLALVDSAKPRAKARALSGHRSRVTVAGVSTRQNAIKYAVLTVKPKVKPSVKKLSILM